MFPRVIYTFPQVDMRSLPGKTADCNIFGNEFIPAGIKCSGGLIERSVTSDYYALMGTDERVSPCAARHPSRCVSVHLKLSDSAFTHERRSLCIKFDSARLLRRDKTKREGARCNRS